VGVRAGFGRATGRAGFHASPAFDEEPQFAIGSGATESACGLMQLRVKRRGQSWEPQGLRGILTIRALVLSDRCETAWNVYAARHRAEARRAA
jgi:hypothetical protein